MKNHGKKENTIRSLWVCNQEPKKNTDLSTLKQTFIFCFT